MMVFTREPSAGDPRRGARHGEHQEHQHHHHHHHHHNHQPGGLTDRLRGDVVAKVLLVALDELKAGEATAGHVRRERLRPVLQDVPAPTDV
jgi:hypothetical protein